MSIAPSNLLIFGRTGQVARELARCAPRALFFDRKAADLMDTKACAKAIANAAPAGVINAAAWTAVDAAESERDAAWTVNAEAPSAMAHACADQGIPFVHISTDYVFEGSGTAPWKPDDETAPLGVYGASKLAGEQAVVSAGGPHAILRTSWVFSAHGSNFVKTMLRLSESRDRLTIVADQIGGPTPAAGIAEACLEIVGQLADAPAKTGIYHYSGAPDVSWANFAREIFELSGRSVEVADIPSNQFPTPAPRPLNSRLDCQLTYDVFGIDRPDWRAGLRAVLAELTPSSIESKQT